MAVRRTPQEAPEAHISSAEFAGPTAHHAEVESAVAEPAPPTPPILPETDDRPRRRSFPAPPPLHQVQPGDLITAQYFNNLVLAVQNLQARVDELEDIYDTSYREARDEAAL